MNLKIMYYKNHNLMNNIHEKILKTFKSINSINSFMQISKEETMKT